MFKPINALSIAISLSLSAFFPGSAVAQWGEENTLTASDAAAYDRFGSSVAISGDYAIVGRTAITAMAATPGRPICSTLLPGPSWQNSPPQMLRRDDYFG